MSEETIEALQRRVQVLEEQLEVRDRLLEIIRLVDDDLEEAILHKWPVARTLGKLLPRARDLLGARAILVRTFDETQRSVDFFEPDGQDFVDEDLDALCGRLEREGSFHVRGPERDLLGYRLDVTDMYLGSVILTSHEPLEDELVEVHAEALASWSEQLDNYLAAIADARHKHQAMQELSDALRVPILDTGLDRGVRVLERYVPYSDLALVLKYEATLDLNTINYRVVSAEGWHASSATTSPGLERALFETLQGDEGALVERFALEQTRERASILAADGETMIGVVSVGVDGELSPFARDILERFADYIRQRVVDFNKDWKRLSHNFPQEVVRRLLQEDRYVERYLSPREREVAILYCDISGFTRLSEQILGEPELIGKLINHWGNKAVEFIWGSGGVFDKMVGDCIIGLWGPPFFDLSPRERCQAALGAARRISDYTRSMTQHADFPELAGHDLQMGVATGLNYCPLFVGTFGPDENFTGFSSGMNNTARLQGLALRDEILCMDSLVDTIGDHTRFGEPRHARVKNVADPLVYHGLLDHPDAEE